ncbi:sirohydrochlorin chelatase [Radiobacillus deserti]|uniref:Sirohydrochlorin chelatase n=1 Tax=Radiobacillus deserti TaxID=2594883 RepID=A0A516KHL4_9BACI|nr:sirohydrochlorin chelatase [Radiobacillus deserti]QDP40877.1 sirohydrochlorin chelatase [Radiobacillus deserti]
MEGVLYVSHGTRIKEGKQEAVQFLKSVQAHMQVPLQEICFLEILSPSIEEGVDKLVKQGAHKISVIPVLLLCATHAYRDIPLTIQAMQIKYPEVSFCYGRPLGVQQRIVNVLEERILDKVASLNEPHTILLVGRGSYMPETKKDIKEIAEKLSANVSADIEICFLAAVHPSFEEALEMVRNRGGLTIILPYLWFDGWLFRYMQEKVEEANRGDMKVVLCFPLGNHPIMRLALLERVEEARSHLFLISAELERRKSGSHG